MTGRRIDHIVVAVQDLDKAADFYRRLGFQVGARNRHPWGTENRIIQLQTSFIELITVAPDAQLTPVTPKSFSFGAFLGAYLAGRQGLAMLVLDSADAKADATLFAERGIGDLDPLFFRRKGKRPDGSEIEVAFTLAFAQLNDAPRAGFFVCQQHFPENFWSPDFQRHDNRAADIASVALAAPQPERLKTFLAAFTGVSPEEAIGHDLTFRLAQGHVDVMTPDDAGEVFVSVEAEMDQPSFVAFAVRVEDIARQAKWLDAAGVPYQHSGSRLIVPASVAFGVAIAFEAT